MNMYDFDGTIYNGDSLVDFIKYSFKKKPLSVSKSIIKTIFKYFKYKREKISFEELKETLFSFVPKIKNRDEFISGFVKKNKHKIKKFYLNQKRKDDLIITASLDFYVKPLCKSVGIKKIISTKYDLKSGRIVGKNCKSNEKEKIISELPKNKFKCFYTDSINDKPLFRFAEKNYIVTKNKIVEYNENYKFKKSIFDLDFLMFVFCGGMGTLTNFIVSSIVSQKINPVLSYVIGYSISLFVSHILNMIYVFRRKLSVIDFVKFVISYIPNFIILFLFVLTFINMLHINKYAVYLMAAIIGLPVTYIILKIRTFKKK